MNRNRLPQAAPGQRNGGRRKGMSRRVNRGINLVSWNCNSIISKKVELARFCDKNNIGVIMVQESKLPKNLPTKPIIAGYKTVHRIRTQAAVADDPSGGGVATLIRNDIPFQVSSAVHVAANDNTTETITINLFDDKGKPLLEVMNVYRPPIKDIARDKRTDRFDPAALPHGPKTIITGDFNAHDPLWDDNYSDELGAKIADWADSKKMVILNDGTPTLLHSNRGILASPDVSLCSADLKSKIEWEVGPDMGSDHLPMLLSYKDGKTPAAGGKPKPCWRKADWASFSAFVDSNIVEKKKGTAQIAQKMLTKAIVQGQEKFVPVSRRKKPKPWWNQKMQDLTKKRGRLRRKAHRSQHNKKLYNEVNRESKKAAGELVKESFSKMVKELDLRGGTKEGWRLLRSMQGKQQPVSREVIVYKGKKLVTDDKKATAFAKMYAEVSRLGQVKKDRDLKRKIRQKLKEDQVVSRYCGPFLMEELEAVLKGLKCGRAPGPDGIYNEVIKNLGTEAKKLLLWCVNRTWSKGEYPNEWRKAIIVPLLKAGKVANDPNSYRPVSLTSNLSKVTERMVKNRMEAWLEDHAKINNTQAGFRSFHSTSTQLGRVTNYVFDGVQEKLPQSSAMVLYDFSRAYDRVWRNKLLVKMIKLGMPTRMVRWTKAFLEARIAKVRYNEGSSCYRKFTQGLPQGSVVSPLLFNIFINDLLDSMPQDSLTSAFADDIATVSQGRTVEECEDKAQAAAKVVEAWAVKNRMKIAVDKCECMLFTSNSTLSKATLKLKINGSTIKMSKYPKFLGITFDRQLSFHEHAKEVKKRCGPKLRLLKLLKKAGMDEIDARRVYIGLIRSAIEYGAEVWLAGGCQSAMKRMEEVQLEGIRSVTGLMRGTSVAATLTEAGEMTMEIRAEVKAGLLMETVKRLPDTHPARTSAESTSRRLTRGPRKGQHRLKSWTTWRETAKKVTSDLEKLPREGFARARNVHNWEVYWSRFEARTCTTPHVLKADSVEVKKHAAEETIRALPKAEMEIYTDGSVREGAGGGGALILDRRDGTVNEQVVAAGGFSSSYNAEMRAIKCALVEVAKAMDKVEMEGVEFEGYDGDRTMVTEQQFAGYLGQISRIHVYTDSKAAIEKLKGGPDRQDDAVGIEIWNNLARLLRDGVSVLFQWIPSHCGVAGNEHADGLAAVGTELPQSQVPIGLRAAKGVIEAEARNRQMAWYKKVVKESETKSRSRGGAAWHYKVCEGGAPDADVLMSMTNADKRLYHQLRSGVCLEARATANTINDRIDKRCPHCKVDATVEHLIMDCSDPAAKGKRVWKTVKEAFGRGKRLVEYWRTLPGRLKFIH